jgi:hypothetical protein
LKCKNYSDVPSMHVLKTAVKEKKQDMRLDSDMFNELRMMLLSFRLGDKDSSPENKGNICKNPLYNFLHYLNVIVA